MSTRPLTTAPSAIANPAWARNGREVFYLDGDGLLTAVPVQTTATTFTTGNAAKILNTRYYAGASTRGFDLRAYEVSPDGQRFLMIKEIPPTTQTSTAPRSTAPTARRPTPS